MAAAMGSGSIWMGRSGKALLSTARMAVRSAAPKRTGTPTVRALGASKIPRSSASDRERA